jgi:N-acetylglucosamine kinase-like BadF-type ATPase
VSTRTEGVLAVDGGQSTVRLRHSDGAQGSAPGVSWRGPATVDATAEAVVSAWRDAGSPPARLAVLGLTTVPATAADRDRLAAVVADGTGVGEVRICDDGIVCHVGALAGDWGITLAVGTGVACAVRGPSAQDASLIGGHGYLLGDEGGGFWIGSRGLAAVLRAAEGRGPATSLSASAAEHFGVLDGLPIRLHADPRAVDRVARFAPEVVGMAESGDAVAEGIVVGAIEELTCLVDAAWRRAGERPATPLVVIGRLASRLEPRLARALAEQPGRFDTRPPRGDALDGAFLLARRTDIAAPLHVWKKG